MIGIRTIFIDSTNSSNYHDILINPINYVIKPKDEAIIITRNSESASNIK